MSESPVDPATTTPKHAGGRPRGSRDRYPRKNPQNVIGAPVTLAPNWELRVERPWQKYAAYLFATGKTVHAIALQLGKCDAAVANLARQPWFKRAVDDLVAELGMDVFDALKAVQHKAVAALERIIDDPRSTPAAVVAAADSVLDRVHGKPTVHIESTFVPSSDPVAEYEQLLREIETSWAGHKRTQLQRSLPGSGNGSDKNEEDS